MADLIGTASIRVDMDTAAAVRSIRRFTAVGNTQLRGMQNRIRATAREMSRIGGASVAVTLDDRTAPGAASVRAAVRDLERLGPVRLNVAVDGAQSLRQLRDTSTDTGRALGVLAPQAVLTGSALGDLNSPAQQASGELRTLRSRAAAAARALAQLAEQAMQTSMALRVLITTTGIAGRHMDSLRDRTRDVRSEMQGLRTSVRLTSDGLRSVGDDSDTAVRALTGLASAGAGAAGAVGTAGGGLGASLKATAAVAGLALLPALGAAVPMMAGVVLAAGTLKTAFSGVGDAVALAGEDSEKYQEALAKMSPEQRNFTRALVEAKKQFGPIGDAVRKAALPGFTAAVKDAGPVVKILGNAMTDMGKAFGDAARGAGRMMKDSGFQGVFQKNLKLGTVFVKDMTQGFGAFTRSLLDFGAASGPTLRAFSDGFSGILSQGLPGFFDGLKTGVSGAAAFLRGLFDSVNLVLPAMGRLSGEVAKVTGPIFGELFRTLGGAGAAAMDAFRGGLVLVRPVLKDIGYGLKTVNDVARIIGPTVKDTALAIMGAFAPVGASIDEAVGPLQRLNRWVNENQIGITEAARIFGGAVIDMSSVAVATVPQIIGAFRVASIGVLEALEGITLGAAAAFSWMPGIGGKMREASKAFLTFKDTYLAGLGAAATQSQEFADEALPRLREGKLQLDINNWQQQLKVAKEDLKTVPPEKESALKAKIKDLEGKIASAKRQIAGVKGKSVTVRADTSPFGAAVGALRNREVGKAYISVYNRYVDNQVAPRFRRAGGPAPRFAGGGMPGGQLSGPGTGTSDSIPMWWASNGEYVINARSTKKYLPLVEAINDDRLNGSSSGVRSAAALGSSELARAIVSMMRGTLNAAAEKARALAAATVAALSGDIGRGLVAGLQAAMPKVAAAAQKATTAGAGAGASRGGGSAPKTGFTAAVAELQRLVDSGRWSRKGSLLFEDIAFQGMSRNFSAQQMKVADGFWAAVNEIKKAVKAGKRVFEDMTYSGMSANVQRFHDVIAQLWKGNPYGRNFGDFGNFGTYGRYGKYAAGGLVRGPGTGTSDSIPILASDREYIVNARQTARNLPLLNAINSGQLTARGAVGTRAAGGGGAAGDVHYHLSVTVENRGVLGSQQDVTTWLARALDDLARTGRLPAALRTR